MENRLREIRKAKIDPSTGKPMTAKKLGELIGKTEAQALRLEGGSRDFTLATLGRCCEVLNCDPEDIVDFPVSKKRKGYDRELMELSIGFLLEACDHYKIKTDNKKQLGELTTKLYDGAQKMDLRIPAQIRDLAMLIVKPAAKGKK